MLRFARKLLIWLVAAVYLVDGVLAVSAHAHGHAGAACGASEAHAHDLRLSESQGAENQGHSRAACPHSHGASLADSPTLGVAEQTPVEPSGEHDCAACRYSSLSAQGAALPAALEFGQALALFARLLPAPPPSEVSSLQLARAPPR